LRVGGRRVEGKIEVAPKRSGLRHDMTDLALETVEESREFEEDIVFGCGRVFFGSRGAEPKTEGTVCTQCILNTGS